MYIPGETNVAGQLRKKAFECGSYLVLVHIATALGKYKHQHYQELNSYIERKFFNYIEMNDLEFNLKVATKP